MSAVWSWACFCQVIGVLNLNEVNIFVFQPRHRCWFWLTSFVVFVLFRSSQGDIIDFFVFQVWS